MQVFCALLPWKLHKRASFGLFVQKFNMMALEEVNVVLNKATLAAKSAKPNQRPSEKNINSRDEPINRLTRLIGR